MGQLRLKKIFGLYRHSPIFLCTRCILFLMLAFATSQICKFVLFSSKLLLCWYFSEKNCRRYQLSHNLSETNLVANHACNFATFRSFSEKDFNFQLVAKLSSCFCCDKKCKVWTDWILSPSLGHTLGHFTPMKKGHKLPEKQKVNIWVCAALFYFYRVWVCTE